MLRVADPTAQRQLLWRSLLLGFPVALLTTATGIRGHSPDLHSDSDAAVQLALRPSQDSHSSAAVQLAASVGSGSALARLPDLTSDVPKSGLRLYILMVTSAELLEQKALRTLELVARHAGTRDRVAFICEPDCVAAGRRKSLNMVEMPDVIPLNNSTYDLGTCQRKGVPCSGYQLASLKYVYGLVSEVNRLKKAGLAKMPEYWMVNDDDTFVHVQNLMRATSRSTDSPVEDKISFAARGGCKICGGAGWVLSGGLATKLVTDFGDKFLRLQIDAIHGVRNMQFQYDVRVPKVVHWVEGARMKYLREMHPFSVLDKKLCEAEEYAWFRECYRTIECNCSRKPKPATWHMSINYNQSWDKLSLIP